MKSFRSHLLAVISFLLLSSPLYAQQTESDSLTLQQAIQLALTNQPSLDQVEAEVNAAEAQVNQAKTSYSPAAALEAGFNRIDPVSSLEFNGNSLKVMPNNNFDAHIAARQLLYDFGKTKENIELARSKTLTAEQQSEVVKWTISYYTAQTFYSILYLDQSINVEDEQISTLNEDLDIAQKKLENGTATNYDVLSIKVRIGEEKNRKLDLMDQKEKLNIRMRKLFGWNPGTEVHLNGSLELKDEENIPNLAEVYTQRPDYKILQQQKETLQHSYNLAGLSNRPTLSAGATAGFKNGYQPNLNDLLGNYSIGLQLEVPLIFNSPASRYKQDEIKANINALEASSRKLQRDIQEQLEQAQTDVQTGKQKLETADLQIEQAEEQLRLAKVRYQNGVITNTDLLAAETALTKARFQKITTTYNILLNQYDLKKAMGEKIWDLSDQNE